MGDTAKALWALEDMRTSGEMPESADRPSGFGKRTAIDASPAGGLGADLVPRRHDIDGHFRKNHHGFPIRTAVSGRSV